MSIIQRVRFAISLLLSRKAAFELLRTWESERAVYPSAGFENQVVGGYRRNELIYACLTLKADSAAQARLRLYDRRGEEDADHAAMHLLRNPNPFMTEFDMLALIMLHLDLAGRSYWEKVRSRAGRVVELWPLRPDWVRVIPAGTVGVRGYEYHVPVSRSRSTSETCSISSCSTRWTCIVVCPPSWSPCASRTSTTQRLISSVTCWKTAVCRRSC